jgi:predicted aldo/keto reductase-like oxidoreductase
MSNEEQMDDNISTFTDFEPLSSEEMKIVDEVTDEILRIPQIGCTACKYCTPGCPMKISIPDVFRTINTLRRYPDDWRSKNFYSGVVSRGGRASDCIGCGQCEPHCPQRIRIPQELHRISKYVEALKTSNNEDLTQVVPPQDE